MRMLHYGDYFDLQTSNFLCKYLGSSTVFVCVCVCVHTAKVQPGEIVLVHAGASGVGTAAIQLLRLTHAISVVTAGSAEKLQMTRNLGAAAAFNYKDEDFAERVLEFTKGN